MSDSIWSRPITAVYVICSHHTPTDPSDAAYVEPQQVALIRNGSLLESSLVLSILQELSAAPDVVYVNLRSPSCGGHETYLQYCSLVSSVYSSRRGTVQNTTFGKGPALSSVKPSCLNHQVS